MINVESILKIAGTFAFLFGELLVLFIGISFIVAMMQVYVSKEKIQRLLTTKHKGLNSILGALLGSVTPFCSCSTVPVLVGLFKSKAPFSGIVSFLLTSPILNPAIVALFLTFFGLKSTLIYVGLTFSFAVLLGLLLDGLGFEKEIKNVTLKGGGGDDVTFESLEGTLLQRHIAAIKHSLREATGLFVGVMPYLLLGAGIGSFIYEFVPQDLMGKFAGSNNLWSVPFAAVIGIPMYIRTETMIPIASILIGKGVGYGTMIALIIGGAGASIPEVSLLSSLFKKKMMIAFVLSIFFVATTAGYLFDRIM